MPDLIPATDRRSLYALAGFVLVCFGIAAIGGAVTTPKIGGWYAALAKPDFQPPNWVFAPVWNVLYALIALAGWRVWRVRGMPLERRMAFRAYALQLALNLSWSIAFFGFESPLAGMAIILSLVTMIVCTIALFWRVDRAAALMLLPYAAWVGYATALNVAIVALN
ncbi:TspO/MBR family protein [Faunimonas sp. B44]|uniref:TspO/MBR family protein n=1 Tax=Faunimonas sp. B44 TaxID=3461493 RepID=UPI004043ABB3